MFGFSYLPLVDTRGMTVRDQIHSLYIYKVGKSGTLLSGLLVLFWTISGALGLVEQQMTKPGSAPLGMPC